VGEFKYIGDNGLDIDLVITCIWTSGECRKGWIRWTLSSSKTLGLFTEFKAVIIFIVVEWSLSLPPFFYYLLEKGQ